MHLCILYNFQSDNRDVDLVLCRHMYSWLTYNHKSDFIGPAGAVEVHFLSNAPQETPKYETIFSPFDRYVWAFSLASLGAVTMALGARSPQQPFVFHWKWSPLSLEREQHDLTKKRVNINIAVSQSMPALYTFPLN